MGKNLTASVENELDTNEISIAYLFQVEFPNTTERFWTGQTQLDYDIDSDSTDETFYPTGDLLSFQSVNETSDGVARGLGVTLSGIDTGRYDNVDVALNDNYKGSTAKCWITLFEIDTSTVIDDPVVLYKGDVDTMKINYGPSAMDIKMQLENPLLRMSPSNITWTDKDQDLINSSDKGLEHREKITDGKVRWGV